MTATRKAVLNERLVGLVGYADNTSLAGATLTIFDVPTAQKLFLQGKDAFSTIWVTADAGGVAVDAARRRGGRAATARPRR